VTAAPRQPMRRPRGGRIDRSSTLAFAFDGGDYLGHPGDTLASALLANGVRTLARSVTLGRPRGVYAAGAEDPCALVAVESGPAAAPLRRATEVELYAGLRARGLAGKGRLDTSGVDPGGAPSDALDGARYDRAYLTCEVLVVGGGPAGLAAAHAAGRTGARVVLCEAGPELGGGLLGCRARLDGEPATAWVDRVAASLAALGEVRVMTRTTAVGYYDHNEVVAVQRRTEHLGAGAPRRLSRQRLWHIRAGRVVLATGAHERGLVFTDNDRPGIMLASAARTYVNRYGVLPGRRAAVFAANDSAYAAALDLLDAGIEIAAVVDVRAEPRPARPPGDWPSLLRERGVEVCRGWVVAGTEGPDELTAVRVTSRDGGDRARTFECDLLAVSGGWNPAVHLFSQSQGRLGYDERLAAFVPQVSAQAERSAGAARGRFGTAAAIEDGFAAGDEAARLAGFPDTGRLDRHHLPRDDAPASEVHAGEAPAGEAGAAYWAVPAAAPGLAARQFVDLARDVTVADLDRATGTGMRAI
jgi:sarcosine oxidase subunit alpha